MVLTLTAILVGLCLSTVNCDGICHDELTQLNSTLVGSFAPSCEVDGTYKKKQCHSSVGQCWCVDPLTGEEINGTRSRDDISCGSLCEQQRSAIKPGLIGQFIPKCEVDGAFSSKQCHGSIGQCFCVDEITGEKINGTENNGDVHCECGKQQRHSARLLGAFMPSCQENGKFQRKQCSKSTGFCWCVHEENGEEIIGTKVQGPVDCGPSECEKLAAAVNGDQNLAEIYRVRCEPDGKYFRKQCREKPDECYCVNPDTGDEIVGTRTSNKSLDCSTDNPSQEPPIEIPKENIKEILHHDRKAPYNISVDVDYTYISLSWNHPDDNLTDLLKYVVYYHRTRNLGENESCPEHFKLVKESSPIDLNTSVHTVHIKNLEAGTRYSMCVQAVYGSNHEPFTYTLIRQTKGCGSSGVAERSCGCDHRYTNSEHACDMKTCICNCKSKYFNDKCDGCRKGYYLHANLDNGSCEKCQCPLDKSDGTCEERNSIVMCNCKEKYTGPHCAACGPGFYKRGPGPNCDPCQCNDNHNHTDKNICDKFTGVCNCAYNTAGDHCEICAEGYEGNALKRTCTKIVSEKTDEEKNEEVTMKDHLHMTTVAGVAVGVFGLVFMIGTVLCIIRWKKLRRKPLNLWTIQLRDDHENVNFSQMMEQDGDVQYFEKDRQPTQSPTRTNKNNIYTAVRT